MVVRQKIPEDLKGKPDSEENVGEIQERLPENKINPSSFKSVFRTAKILNCVSRGIGSITDIAAYCQVDKASIHRLLQALCETRLIVQDPITRQYHLGTLISEITSNPLTAHNSLITCADTEMRHLAECTGETVGLSMLVGLQRLTLHIIPSSQDFRIVPKNTFVDYLYIGATARVLLSQLNPKAFKIIIANLDFKPFTENTIIYKEQLLSQVIQVKQQGYAVSYGERIPGAMDISVPVKNYSSPVSLSILGPEIRMKPRINDFIQELTCSSDRINQSLKKVIK
jgi:IclR family transcriptional regulator, KDG regulon repressor